MKTIIISGITFLVLLSFGNSAMSKDSVYKTASNLANKGEFEKAIKLLNSHLEKHKDDIRSRILTGRMLNFIGEDEKAIEVLKKGLSGKKEDIDLYWFIARLHLQLGKDGLYVKRVKSSIIYLPNRDEAKDRKYKMKHLNSAITALKECRNIKPEIIVFERKIIYIYFLQKNFKAASIRLEKLAAQYPEDTFFKEKLINAYFESNQKRKAVDLSLTFLKNHKKSAIAYKILSEYFKETGDHRRAALYSQQKWFYTWLPAFCEIDFSQKNYKIANIIAGKNREKLKEKEFLNKRNHTIDALLNDSSDTSLYFLAALIYQHDDHGNYENKAFEKLKEADGRGIAILKKLLKNSQTACTTRGAVHALVDLRAPGTYELIIRYLPGDYNYMWHADIAGALAKLGDKRAVPHLIKVADMSYLQPEKSIEDDPVLTSTGRLLARIRAVLALGSFKSNQVIEELKKGTTNPQLSSACYTALYQLTGERKYYSELLKKLKKDPKDFTTRRYFMHLKNIGDEEAARIVDSWKENE
jgi:hypothetical protein